MKKILVFIVALIMIISITSVSFAKISTKNSNPSFDKYLGAWFGEKDERKYVIVVGCKEGYYYAAYIEYKSSNYAFIYSPIEQIFTLTYDYDTNAVYLSANDDIYFKIKLTDNGILELYNMDTGVLMSSLSKQQ